MDVEEAQNTKRKGQNMKNMKMMNAMRMRLFCLATLAMAMMAAHLTAQVFTTLHSFTAPAGPSPGTNSDGYWPEGSLALSGKTLYGTAQGGGDSLWGTVFSLALESQLNILLSGANVILTWPANAAGFTLQSATNLVSQSVWSTNLPAPVIVNGQNTVTNPISGAQQFYRLTQ
jgi:uncharacterized repeat protein (TIGR03803 family)